MLDGYCFILRNILDPNDAKFNNMKSYDCHVFMKTLLPIVFNVLPNDVLKPFIENLCLATP